MFYICTENINPKAAIPPPRIFCKFALINIVNKRIILKMKKILTILLIAIAYNIGHSQELSKIDTRIFEVATFDSIPSMLDDILSNCSRDFILKKYDKVSAKRYQFKFRGATAEETDSVPLIVAIEEKIVGGNPKLDIPPTTIYEAVEVWGKFQDVAQIWNLLENKSFDDLVNASHIDCHIMGHDNKDRRYRIRQDQYSKDRMFILKRTW